MIDIYTLPIPTGPRQEARRRERIVIERMVSTIFGPQAHYSHRPDGSPCIPGFSGSLSVSHSHNLCAIAMSTDENVQIGIDVESWRDQLRRIAPRFLCAGELPVYGSHPHALLQAWTAKEAAYKTLLTPGLAFQEILLPATAPQPQAQFEIQTPAGACIALTLECNIDTAITIARNITPGSPHPTLQWKLSSLSY